MSQTLLANILYFVGFLGALTLEHFGIIPTGTSQIIQGAIGGAALTSGTLTVTKGQAVSLKAPSVTTTPNTGIHDGDTQIIPAVDPLDVRTYKTPKNG